MSPETKDKAYLWDISEACRDILQFIEGIDFNEFSSNKMIKFAVERQILVIGEAARHLSENFTEKNPEIPWKKIIGMRNIIAHEYGEILVDRIWFTAKNHIAELLNHVSKYLEE